MTRASSTEPTFDLPQAGLAVFGAIVLGVITGLGWALSANWADGQAGAIVRAAVTCTSVWMLAAAVGLDVLYGATGRKVDRLGFAVLASSMARMLTALSLGLAAHFIASPDGRTFWTCFLIAGLLALMAETVWVIRTINLQSSTLTGVVP